MPYSMDFFCSTHLLNIEAVCFLSCLSCLLCQCLLAEYTRIQVLHQARLLHSGDGPVLKSIRTAYWLSQQPVKPTTSTSLRFCSAHDFLRNKGCTLYGIKQQVLYYGFPYGHLFSHNRFQRNALIIFLLHDILLFFLRYFRMIFPQLHAVCTATGFLFSPVCD